MSNSKKAIKNSVYGSFSQIIIVLLKFVERRFFVLYLSIEYLGLKSLFGNLFSLFSIAELGIGTIINYQLYTAIANDDKNEINKLMSIYKLIYCTIGLFILLVGVLCCFLLPYLISNQTVSFDYLIKIYFLMLLNVVISYFLSYRTTLYIAAQNQYICLTISTGFEVIFSILKLVIIYVYKNYILYLIIDILKSIIVDASIYLYAKKIFDFLCENIRISIEDIKNRNFFSDIKNILCAKLGGTVYFGTDSILISKLFGINFVAIYTNYYLLYTSFRGITFNKYIAGINPSIANYLHTNKDDNKKLSLFNKIDLFNHYCGMIFSIGFCLFANPVVYYWLGAENLLSFDIVIVYCIYIYIETSFESLNSFRAAFGEFEFDKKYFLYAAIFNIIFSILFSKMFGISGIIFGTIIGFIFIAYGRWKFVYYKIIKMNVLEYLIKHLFLIIEFAIIFIVTTFVSYLLDYSILNLIYRVLFLFLIMLLYILIEGKKNKDFSDLMNYIESVFSQFGKVRTLYNKLKNRRD